MLEPTVILISYAHLSPILTMHPHMYPPALTIQEFAAKDLDYIIIGGGTAGLTVAVSVKSPSSKSASLKQAKRFSMTLPSLDPVCLR